MYNDGIVGKTLDALTSVITASGPSGQHQTCSRVLEAFSGALPQLSPEHQQMALDRLQRVLPLSTRQVFTNDMQRAFGCLRHAVCSAGLHDDATRLAQIETKLSSEHSLASPEPHNQR